ncbi:MAG: alpha/beta hydrolase [Chloroflexi bacterium]|nr:alpha/beta hydrolase [Chloroflexota bacterium]
MQTMIAMDHQEHLFRNELLVQGAKIVTYERGQGTPALLLHGAPDTHEMWVPVVERLNETIRAIMVDLPGFGESTLPADFDLSLDNMADFVRDLITALGINEPVILITTDFGGHYGLAFTAKYPDLVKGIAISNTNFFHDYQWHPFARMYRVPVLGELLVGLAGRSKSMSSKALKDAAPRLPDEYIERSFETGFGVPSVRKTMLRMYRARASKDFIGWEDKLLDVLETKPAIVLWGDQDPFITPAYGDRFGNAKVHHFADYSHWLPVEAPDEYTAALNGWSIVTE